MNECKTFSEWFENSVHADKGIADREALRDSWEAARSQGEAAGKVEWSEHRRSNEDVCYDHVVAETPFGLFVITWKGWKEHDCPTVDETPWGDHFGAFGSVEDAKVACEEEFTRRLRACGLNTTPPVSAAPGGGWIRCSERTPAEADEDCEGRVWLGWPDGKHIERVTRRTTSFCEGFWWMPTGLKRPNPPAKGEG